MKMKRIDRRWCKDDDETSRTRKVQSFLEKVEWRKEEGDDMGGGCTWVELYALYATHGVEEDAEKERRSDPLRKPQMFQAQLAAF